MVWGPTMNISSGLFVPSRMKTAIAKLLSKVCLVKVKSPLPAEGNTEYVSCKKLHGTSRQPCSAADLKCAISSKCSNDMQ
jgi:hypothetical protein